MNKYLKIIIVLLFLPLVLIIDAIKIKRAIWKKIIYILLIIIFLSFTWISAFNSIKNLSTVGLYEVGITDKLSKIKVVGNSMLPTIKSGSEVTLKSPHKYGIARGDIVSFSNKETSNSFYIKRVIGLPGENIVIKNGHYFINNKELSENYTLNSLPTFGNTFLADCENITIPNGEYFVSGDNRTVSYDSRAIGFVRKEDIDGVIKTELKENFEDSESNGSLQKKGIDINLLLKKINEKRSEARLYPLISHPGLTTLSNNRADQIKNNFDEWKKNNISVDKLLDSKGYRFNLVHEYVTFGYLDEDGIIGQIFDSPTEKDNFLSTKFTEVGIGISERTFKECTYPVISIILSWPSLATYDKAIMDSWAKEITYTNDFINDYQIITGVPENKKEVWREIINSLSQQNQIATRIYNRMKNQEWLTQKDYQDIELYNQLVEKSNKLSDEFSGVNDIKGVSTRKDDVRRL